MNKRTTTTIMTRLGWGAFFLALIFLAIQVMPRALGQRQSADISKGSSNVEAPLLNQQPTPLTPVITGTLGTAPPGGDTGTLATRINRPGTGPTALVPVSLGRATLDRDRLSIMCTTLL